MGNDYLIHDNKDIDFREELEAFLEDNEYMIRWISNSEEFSDPAGEFTFSVLVTEPKVGYIEMTGTRFQHILETARNAYEHAKGVDLENIRKAIVYEGSNTDLGKRATLTKYDIVKYKYDKPFTIDYEGYDVCILDVDYDEDSRNVDIKWPKYSETNFLKGAVKKIIKGEIEIDDIDFSRLDFKENNGTLSLDLSDQIKDDIIRAGLLKIIDESIEEYGGIDSDSSSDENPLNNFIEDNIDNLLSKSEFAEKLGISVHKLEKKMRDDKVIYLIGKDKVKLPESQIKDGEVLKTISILNDVTQFLGRLSLLGKIQYYFTPKERLGGMKPIEYIREHGYDDNIKNTAYTEWRQVAE